MQHQKGHLKIQQIIVYILCALNRKPKRDKSTVYSLIIIIIIVKLFFMWFPVQCLLINAIYKYLHLQNIFIHIDIILQLKASNEVNI